MNIFIKLRDVYLKTEVFFWQKIVFRYFLKRKDKRSSKVIIGAGTTRQKGFFPTDIQILDVTKARDWLNLFTPNSIEVILAEHLYEHLTIRQIEKSLLLCFRFLRRGGNLRIAVPDGNHPDPKYLREVSPPKDGHKVLLNHRDLERILKKTGFKVKKLEYYNDAGEFIKRPWNENGGLIKRSFRFDRQRPFKYNGHYYVSLIVDAVKP
jgi:predicted SAM-dependent methyltransferase